MELRRRVEGAGKLWAYNVPLNYSCVKLLADAVETYAATSRTGSRPPDAVAIPDDGVNAVVLELAEALCGELEARRAEASGSAVAAFANLCDKAGWAADVLRLRS